MLPKSDHDLLLSWLGSVDLLFTGFIILNKDILNPHD